ncbi:GDP-mannose 4,6-dehydratase [Marivivens sp. JLT3646]|uniref:GDP-mannose 4,6-dehydratase n=1 Tax=Marivivens sp. JLT3646 TaxID=1920883 RepID=UPI000801C5D6|nr:GDP-mannose 4,6-dehydratase [Marivivens sp. JLT3646]APO88600.1 GDP-mannose 4,6 dehydratase [Marivivens sp. JLT3646]OBR39361.1 GDP-mannose 4,6 dehydratase [Donghicola sp. JL3646]
MHILATGANGFTGRYFRKVAESLGHTVWPLAADLTDKSAVCDEVAQVRPTAVVHLAAISFVAHVDEIAFYNVNVLGTLNLLAALAALPVKPKKVLLASSANVYGNCITSPITETQQPYPVNHYANSKLAMEHMALTYGDRVPLVIARPFNYTGVGQGQQFLIPKLVHHFARRDRIIELGNLHVEREFNDVRMICDAYLGLLTNGLPGQVYNVCTGHPYTLKQVIATLEQITGHRLDVQVNPAFVRANEVRRLCGNPDKLIGCVGRLKNMSLAETLTWMIDDMI